MKIQACIGGYSGERATVYSLYRDDILLVAKVAAFREDRFEGSVIVSNTMLPARDAVFGEEHLKVAIDAMQMMKSAGTLHVDNMANAADPSYRVEFDSMDTAGRRYRLHPEITNAQVAVLATIWYVSRAKVRQDTVDMAAKLADLMRGGGIISV